MGMGLAVKKRHFHSLVWTTVTALVSGKIYRKPMELPEQIDGKTMVSRRFSLQPIQ